MQPYKIPKSIDEPFKLLVWDVRDMGPVVAGIMAGILAGKLWPFLLAGMGFAYASRKFRDRRQDGWGTHALYWIGLLPIKGAPNPFIRRYLP